MGFFIMPENLQARVMHDVPAQLSQMRAEVDLGAGKVEETVGVDEHYNALNHQALTLPPR
jgi:hypothetical protein